MASKRKRKLQQKAAREVDPKMQARRDSFNDMMWRFGPPFVALVIILSIVFVVFIYEPGNPKPEPWELEETSTGKIYSSDYYYDTDQLILVEFFHSECGHCNQQAPILRDIYDTYMDNSSEDYTSSFHMFSIGLTCSQMFSMFPVPLPSSHSLYLPWRRANLSATILLISSSLKPPDACI